MNSSSFLYINYFRQNCCLIFLTNIFLGVDLLEVKINREIRDYSEAVYFGLNLRQFIFSILACGVAVFVVELFELSY